MGTCIGHEHYDLASSILSTRKDLDLEFGDWACAMVDALTTAAIEDAVAEGLDPRVATDLMMQLVVERVQEVLSMIPACQRS